MHEHSLLNDLFKKIDEIARNANASAVTKVHVKIGALAHISADHFKEHFDEMRHSSFAKDAEIIITESHDIHDKNAQDITLLSIDVSEE